MENYPGGDRVSTLTWTKTLEDDLQVVAYLAYTTLLGSELIIPF